jgi:class 3 adenylate cyclase
MNAAMVRPKRLDLLFALTGTSEAAPMSPAELLGSLEAGGLEARPDAVLAGVLGLERSGHVAVGRDGGYAFGLTPLGEEAAHELGPGEAVALTVVMIDLVGFVAFTEAHGDDAAHRAARQLHDIAHTELRLRSGRVVKPLGDGVLAALPADADAADAVTAIARRCRLPDGSRWPIRSAARRGRPIAHGGDLFGADVNLVARLCDAARPDELVVALDAPADSDERLDVRGLASAVAVVRVPVP